MTSLAEIRESHPELNDLSDQEVTAAVHKMYQADTGERVKFNTFAKEFGLKTEATWGEALSAIPPQIAGSQKLMAGGALQMLGDPQPKVPLRDMLVGKIPTPPMLPPGTTMADLPLEEGPLKATVPEGYRPPDRTTYVPRGTGVDFGLTPPSEREKAIAQMEDPAAPGFMEPAISRKGRKIAESGRKQIKEARPENLTFWQGAVTDASISTVMAGEAAIAALLTKNPHMMALGFGAGEMARGYDEAKSEGKPRGEALRYAAINGVIEAGTEYLPAKAMFKAGSKPLMRLTQVLGHELVGENIAEVSQKLNAHIHGLDDDVSAKDFLDTIKRTSAATLLGSSVQSGVASGIHKVAERQTGRKAQEKMLGKMLLEQVEKTELGETAKQVEAPQIRKSFEFLGLETGAQVQDPLNEYGERAPAEDEAIGVTKEITFPDARVRLSLREEEDTVYLTGISTRTAEGREAPGTGRGTEAVNALKEYADATGKRVAVVSATAEALPFWNKFPWLKKEKVEMDVGGETFTPKNSFVYKPAMEEISRADQMQPGETYKGMIPESELEQGPIERGATATAVRREEIISPLLKALNVPLYQGKGKMKGTTLGYFIPSKEVVRVKRMSDIEVVGHELAHLIDKRVFGYGRGKKRPWTGNKTFTKELKGLSYDKHKTHEGFAEFVRHWLTNPEFAQNAAPNFFNWWEQWVDSHEYGPPLKAAQNGMMGWFAQSRQARAASKIGRIPDVNEWNTSRVDDARQSVLDDLNGLLLTEQAITERKDALPGGPYEKARNMRGARATMDGVLMWGPPVWSEGKLDFRGRDGLPSTRIVQKGKKQKIEETPGWKPWGLRDVLDPVADQLEDFMLYAVGRRAAVLRGEGREKLFSKAEIQGMLDLETPTFKAVFEDYQKWNKAIVDFAVGYGHIIPKSVAKKFDSLNYIPFYRVGTTRGGKKSKALGDVSVVHRLTGGTGNLNDILDNMILNAERLVVESIKNRARMETVDFIDKSGVSGHFFEQIPKSAVPVGVDREQVINEFIKGLGLDPKAVRTARKTGDVSAPGMESALYMIDLFEENLADYVQFWQHGRPPGGKNLVAVLRDGKPTYYEVIDPLLYRSFEAFNRPIRGNITRILSKTRRFGQATVTLTLEFLTANMWRDTWHGWVFSKHGFKPLLGTLEGMTHRIKHDATYRQFLANGGGLASIYTDPEAFETNLKGFYHGKGINFNTVINPRNWVRGLILLADAAEMSTRLGEYTKGIEKGEIPSTAVYGSREISTDFGMRGDNEYVNIAYDSIIFLKAASNGLDRAYRGFVKDENRASIAAKTGAIATASVLLALYNITDDDDWYNDLEDWDKNAHWHAKAKDVHLRFPKIWEIGGIASLAERTMEAYLKDEYGDLWKQAGQIILDQLKMEYLPYLTASSVEVYGINRNRFTERPIETTKMQELDPALRYRTGTSELSRAAAEGMLKADIPMEIRDKLSPVKIDALIKGYFNTWGMYGLMLSDEVLGENRPKRRLWEYPGLRRFMAPKVPRHTRYTSSFWDFHRRSVLFMNSLREAAKQSRPDYVEKFIGGVEEHKGRAAEGVARALRGYAKEAEQVRVDKKLSPEEKAEMIDEIQERYNALTKQFMIEHGGMK